MSRFVNRYGRLLASSTTLAGFALVLFCCHPRNAVKVTLDEAQAATLTQEAKRLMRTSKWDQALVAVSKLSAAFPENGLYYQDLANIYNHLGKTKEEAAAWEQFMGKGMRPIEACPQIGKAYQKLGQMQEAVTAFERCMALEPNNLDSLFFLAHAYEMAGEPKAEELYTKGMELKPSYTDFAIGLARITLRKGDAAAARKLVAPILKNTPDNTDALFVMAGACRKKGDRTGARKYYLQGVKLVPDSADFRLPLAQMAEEDKDIPAAIEHYQALVDADSSNASAAERLSELKKRT